MRERAEIFYLASQPRRNPSPGCVNLCMNNLKFPFFDSKCVYIEIEVSVSKQIFIRQEVRK